MINQIPKKILLIDDDDDFCNLMTIFLTSKGIVLHFVKNGLDAINLLSSDHFDLIITEVNLPMMDGLRFVKWLRQDMESTTPILVLTATIQKDIHDKMLDSGANKVIHKPLGAVDILNHIHDGLNQDR